MGRQIMFDSILWVANYQSLRGTDLSNVFSDGRGGRRGHDDVPENRQERYRLFRHAGFAAHRVSELQNDLRILGNVFANGYFKGGTILVVLIRLAE